MGSLGLVGGGETGGDEAVDLGMHGLGATAGFVLLRVAGEGREAIEDWERRPGLGAMGGGQGLVVAGSLGLGANGGFFTPARKEEGRDVQEKSKVFTHTSFQLNHVNKECFMHPSLNINIDSCKLWLNAGSIGHSEGQRASAEGLE